MRRDFLNLKALKRSAIKHHCNKQLAIYEKAHEMLKEGWKTKDIDTEEIMSIASKFPQLNVKVMIGGDIFIKSKRDTWIIKDESRFLTLYHKDIVQMKSKDTYHVQDVFYDLDFALASIVAHDDHSMGIKTRELVHIKQMAYEGS
ncbi:hypothetical protein P4639_22130 [Priestia megaterium]|uniref:hypothetical protein n=1 Tax=Priestia megaterium TaxID=1404 RepID=UPI002E233245|nr:hypothetical protein [Priestia megaterium]